MIPEGWMFNDSFCESTTMENTLEEQKQIIKHLNNHVQNHMKEKNTLMDMNLELERIINAKNDEIIKYLTKMKKKR